MTGLVAGRAAGGEAGSVTAQAPATHLVRPGDTLWEIARARVGSAGDPRPLVQALREANGLGNDQVQVGEMLLVPAAP
jgi:Tfp pilus assembly protein FimV